MDNNNTSIKYSEVKNGINVLKNETLPKMRNIFSDFGESIRRAGAEDVFAGDASESLKTRFNDLSNKFTLFEDLVIKFANEFETAAAATSQTEQKLSQDAGTLSNGN